MTRRVYPFVEKLTTKSIASARLPLTPKIFSWTKGNLYEVKRMDMVFLQRDRPDGS